MKRKDLLIGAVVLLTALAPRPSAQSEIIQRVLVKVNGDIYTQTDLQEAQVEALREKLNRNALSIQDLQNDATLKPALEQVTPLILVNAVDELLIVQKGRDLGYHMTDEQFQDSVNQLKKDYKLDDAGFLDALKQQGTTLAEFHDQLNRQYIVRQVQQQEIMGHMSLTEEEARQYYDAHHDEFMTTPTVMLRELLVAVPVMTGAGAQSMFSAGADQTARQKIQALRARAENGEDFAKLVGEASEAPSKSKGGLVGPVNLSDLAAGIRDALTPLKAGEITQPIRTTRGYQIFQLVSRTTPTLQPFADVRDAIAQKVYQERLAGAMTKYLAQLRADALIEWKRDDLRQMYEKELANEQAADQAPAQPAAQPKGQS